MSSCLPQLCNELRALRRVRHPNIVFLYGACMDVDSNKLCLVLEFVDGVPLGAFCTAPATSSARSLVVFDVLNALRYLHSMHPSKDSNILVEERRSGSGRSSYRAKLLDFGLSRLVTRNARPLGGTLRWMAPSCSHARSFPQTRPPTVIRLGC
ncbi:unnamed protein product [Prorocentrum cordatum]|uniref:Protein kinase domain-containing protein n=1 Tax=Prorocentrum cordatum TaxID=2364126 RepID=A0ABN9XXB3_9DINO|nr:unnamed protein product [Polarella glacialis]